MCSCVCLFRIISFNRISGTVPASFSALTNLLSFAVVSNYLSCEVGLPSTGQDFLLVAPGNRFQALPASGPFDHVAGPSADPTSGVSFLWVGTPWQTWRWPLVGCALGFIALITTVATTGVLFLPAPPSLSVNLLPTAPSVQRGLPAMRTRLWRFVCFEPHPGVGVAQLWCARQLAWLAVPCIAIVSLANVCAPAHLYTCGKWLTKYLTIAYIKGPAAEWTLAVAACAFPCAAARLVLRFQQMLQVHYKPRTQPPPAASNAAILCMYAQYYAVLIVIGAIVPVAYAISTSVPSEALGTDRAWILPLISETTSLVLSMITTLAIPSYCRYLSQRVFGAAGNPLLTSRLMQFARLWISILAPALAVAVVHEDCLGGWVLLWPQCASRTDYEATMFVCSWRGSIPPGHCSRAVIESLELLLLSKLAYAAFLLPAGVLLRSRPLWALTKEAVVRRCKPTYRAGRFAVDSEFAALLM